MANQKWVRDAGFGSFLVYRVTVVSGVGASLAREARVRLSAMFEYGLGIKGARTLK